jgi:peptidoglycan/LPS O-acetylase OafA/YrhL
LRGGLLTNSASSKPNSSKEFAGLEIARFLCALAVILWHYQHFFVKGAFTTPELLTV